MKTIKMNYFIDGKGLAKRRAAYEDLEEEIHIEIMTIRFILKELIILGKDSKNNAGKYKTNFYVAHRYSYIIFFSITFLHSSNHFIQMDVFSALH